MQSEEMKKKGLKGVKTIIFGRTLIVVFAFLIQFALIISSFIWLKDYSFYIYAGFVVLGVLVLLHLFNSRGNPDFKLVWMLPLTVVPVFGALFYLYINSPEASIPWKIYKTVCDPEGKGEKRFRTEESPDGASGFLSDGIWHLPGL